MVLFIPNTPKLSNFPKGYTGKLPINDRKLAERSHLAIEFPQPKGRVIRTFIPFLENPMVTEKGAANLNEYNLVGRAGQLFSYGGAQSRKLSVTFQISLLHLLEEEPALDNRFKQMFKVFFSERNAAKAAFDLADDTFENEVSLAQAAGPLGSEQVLQEDVDKAQAAADEALDNAFKANLTDVGDDRDHAAIHRNYYRGMVDAFSAGQIGNQDNALLESIGSFFGAEARGDDTERVNKVINYVVFYINLIRGSVLNNSTNTIYGPPILRLTHGTLYNNVPCLLESYSIDIDGEAGYDVQTLTPKRIRVSLELVESRAGNFGNFKTADIFNGDNLTGWESIIENNNMDPYNGGIGDVTDDTKRYQVGRKL